MSLAIQLGNYVKFTPKWKATTLAYLACTKCYSGKQPCHTASYRTWGAYAASDDINVLMLNLLVESGHVRLASYTGT